MGFGINFDTVWNIIIFGLADKACKILIKGSRNNDVRQLRLVFQTNAIRHEPAEKFIESIEGKPAPETALRVDEFFEIVIGVGNERLIFVRNESSSM